jgi:hypothetical protein
MRYCHGFEELIHLKERRLNRAEWFIEKFLIPSGRLNSRAQKNPLNLPTVWPFYAVIAKDLDGDAGAVN